MRSCTVVLRIPTPDWIYTAHSMHFKSYLSSMHLRVKMTGILPVLTHWKHKKMQMRRPPTRRPPKPLPLETRQFHLGDESLQSLSLAGGVALRDRPHWMALLCHRSPPDVRWTPPLSLALGSNHPPLLYQLEKERFHSRISVIGTASAPSAPLTRYRWTPLILPLPFYQAVITVRTTMSMETWVTKMKISTPTTLATKILTPLLTLTTTPRTTPPTVRRLEFLPPPTAKDPRADQPPLRRWT